MLCQAGREAGGGDLGPVITVMGAHRAGWLLQSLGRGTHRDTVRLMTQGVAGADCELLHHCTPSHCSPTFPSFFSNNYTSYTQDTRRQLDRMRQILGTHVVY